MKFNSPANARTNASTTFCGTGMKCNRSSSGSGSRSGSGRFAAMTTFAVCARRTGLAGIANLGAATNVRILCKTRSNKSSYASTGFCGDSKGSLCGVRPTDASHDRVCPGYGETSYSRDLLTSNADLEDMPVDCVP